MNKESLNINDNSNTETLEKQEKSPVDVESKESGQEFAEKILAKIKGYMNSFLSKKEAIEKIEGVVSFDDPTIKEQIKSEINLDSQLDEIDNEAKIIQTEASKNVNLVTRDFSKAYHHPEYRDRVAKEIKEARNSGEDAEAARSSFYDKTASEKENFESQEKERSVAEIMKEKDLLIVHGISLKIMERKSTVENNPILKSGGHQDFETSIEILSGLSPTISASIPSPEKSKNGLYYRSGVILGEGKVLSANSTDSGSVAHGLYKRIPKHGEARGLSAIDSKININDNLIKKNYDYNELTVEKPQIAGLFYDLTEDPELPLENPEKERYIKNFISLSEITPSQEKIQEEIADIDESWEKRKEQNQLDRKEEKRRQEFELYSMKKYSEKFNVPLYVFKKENEGLKKYKIKFLPREKEKYFLEVLKPKADQLFIESQKDKERKKEYENFIYGDEYLLAKNESLKIKKEDYVLEEVTAEDIYESKRDISDEERKKMIEDIKKSGILTDSAEKEVDKKFNKNI